MKVHSNAMNKLVIAIVGVLLLLVALPFVVSYLLSFHTVTLSVSGAPSARLYKLQNKKEEQVMQSINSATTLRLQNGTYCAKPTAENYQDTPVCFTVENKDLAASLDFSFTQLYLDELLKDQQASINKLIKDTYKEVIDGFVLKDGMLLGQGDWYGTTLTKKVARGDQGDVYRVLLKKSGDAWSIVTYPQIVLSKFNYPDVPYSVLDTTNKIVGIQGAL